MNDLTWSSLNGTQIPDSDKAVAAAARDEEQTMNMITPLSFAKLRQETEDNPTLAKLMKAWEEKLGKNTKRATSFGLVAVTLAACGGGSGDGNGENGENGENGTTPVPAGGSFTVVGFPTVTEPSMFVTDSNGVRVPADLAVELLANVLDIDMGQVASGGTVEQISFLADQSLDVDLSNLTAEDIAALVQSNLGDAFIGGGGAIVIGDGLGQVTAVDLMAQLLTLVQYDEISTIGRVIITPNFNGGNIVSPDFAFGPGDQFSDNLAMGVTGDGNDVITFSALEFFHGAIVDGGGGENTIRLVAKTPYAQPTLVTNVQTIEVSHQPNVSNLLTPQIDPNTINLVGFNNTVLTLPDLNTLANLGVGTVIGSWIDLGAVVGLETLRISDSTGFASTATGDLTIIGLESNTTVVMTNEIWNEINVDFGFGGGAVVNVVLDDVNMEDALNIGHNSPTLRIESTGTAGSSENYLARLAADFGGNLRTVEISGDVFLHVNGTLAMNGGRATTVDASANTAGVKLELENSGGDLTDLANNHINFTGSQGDDTVALTAHSLDISTTGGTNIFDIAGTYALPSFNFTNDPNSQVTGLQLTFDGADSTDTLIFNLGVGGSILYNVDEPTVTLLQGSTISGANNTIVAFDPTDLSQATLEGIVSIVMNGTVTVSSEQLGELGAGLFSSYRSAEVPALTQNLHVLVEGDVTLSELIDTADLSSNVKLTFFIPEGASLTLSAEELHNFLAVGAIEMGDGSDGTSAGELIITDAGQNFDPFDSTAVGPDGLPYASGGTIDGDDNNITVERSADGWDRPSQAPLDDELVIDSSDGPVEVGANGFDDPTEFSITQTDTLIVRGENDVTFTAPVNFVMLDAAGNFVGRPNFSIDFSGVEGAVTGLEIVDFNNITVGDPSDWGSITGNGGARIDVQLSGNVANGDNGLTTSGVATYVVTDLNDGDRQFWTSVPTEDVEVLGLQGNYGNSITFGNVVAGVTFLMEVTEDKFDAFSVGRLVADFARDGVVDAVVNVVGLQPLPEGEVQTVAGINLTTAKSATINVEGGDTLIEVFEGEDTLTEVTFTADGDLEIESDLLPDLTVIDASGVAGTFTASIVSPAEEFVFTGGEGGSVLTLSDVDGENTIDGGAGGADLIIDGMVDLSDSTLINITSVTLEHLANLTMTAEQVVDLGGFGSFTVEDGDSATLTLSVTEDFDVDALDLDSLPEGLELGLSIQSEVEFNITGDQLVALFEAGVTISDGSGNDDPGTINITDVNQTHLPFPEINDYSTMVAAGTNFADIAGTVSLEAGAEVYVGQGYGPFPGLFAWELEGGTLGLSNAEMANGLVVNNGDIKIYFTDFAGEEIRDTGNTGIDAEGYTNIGTIFVTDLVQFMIDPFNIESFGFLDSDTVIEIVPLVQPEFDGTDRFVVVGGLPFAINEDGSPYNPATGDAGPVVEPTLNLIFDNVSGDANRNVETVTMVFSEGGNELGDITIGAGEAAGNAFRALTLISTGDDVNTIRDVDAVGNTLLNVAIEAAQEFVARTIEFTSNDPDLEEAVFTVTGTADVTLKSIVAGAGVTNVITDASGHTGVLDITGGSASISATESLEFVGGDGTTILLDTDEDNSLAGVDGNDTLASIDASGMAEGSTLALGRIVDVNQGEGGFTLTGGEGVLTGEMVFAAFPDFEWSFNLGDAAEGSALAFNIGGDELFSLTSGGITRTINPDTDRSTLRFDDGTTLEVEADINLSDFADTRLRFGDDVTIVLGEDGLVRMSDRDFAAFEEAEGSIEGVTEKTFSEPDPADPADPVDLSDVRGLTQIDLTENTGPYILDSAQVAIARVVDEDGEPLSENGDIGALKDAGVLSAINIVEGNTLALTDVEADELSVTGEGSVTIDIIGNAGANITVTPSENNDGGQSITIPYTLDGEDGTVSINSSDVNFTQAGAMTALLETRFGQVDGITAEIVGGTLQVRAEVAGTPLSIGDATVVGGDDLAVEVAPAVSSTADMSGVTLVDTVHVFRDLDDDDGGYDLTGASLGGAADEDGNVTITLQSDVFIDASGLVDNGEVPAVDDEGENTLTFIIDGDAELKLADADLKSFVAVESTGAGFVQVINPADADLSGVDVPVTALLTANTVFTGTFNGGQTVTVNDPAESDPELVLDITGATGLPASFVLVDTSLALTVVQANGLTIEGGSTAIVVMTEADTNAILSTISGDVDLVMDVSPGDSAFGGELPAGDLTVAGGNTLTFKPEVNVTVSSITVSAGTTLALTGAQASGVTIEGEGAVVLTEVAADDDLSGIAVEGGLTVQFDDAEASEFTLPAAAIAGNTVSVENVAGGIDLLTVTDVDGDNTDFSGLTVTAGEVDDEGVVSPGEANVTFAVGLTGNFEFGEDTDFGVTTAGDVTVAITGTGTVTVDEDADMTGVTAYTVGANAILVTDTSRAGEDDFVNPALVSGGGRLQYTELDGATVAATDSVRTNEFVFDSEDTGVTINDFEAIGALNGRFVFDDDDPLDPILETMRLDLTDFGVTGGFEATVVGDLGDLDFDATGVIVITDGTLASIEDVDFSSTGLDADNAEGAQAFFVVGDGADAVLYFWDDANNDGVADSGEITPAIATLTNVDLEDLGSQNFLI